MTALLSMTRTARSAGTVRPAPRREPPFDDELEAHHSPVPGRHELWLPFAQCSAPRSEPLPEPRPRPDLPDPARWGRRVLVGLVETAAGRRPLQQLSAMLSRSVAYGLSCDFERCAQLGRPHWMHAATVRTVKVCQPADGVAELCATFAVGGRVRAVAMRLESPRGRWCCTRLQLG